MRHPTCTVHARRVPTIRPWTWARVARPLKLTRPFALADGNDGPRYAQWAADLVAGLGTGVPTVMCQQTGVTGVIESCNGFCKSTSHASPRTPCCCNAAM